MSRGDNQRLVHRHPDGYDLPRGEWMCSCCAAAALGVGRGQLWKVAADECIDSIRARHLTDPRRTAAASFFDAYHVRDAIRRRRQAYAKGMQWFPARTRPSTYAIGA